MVKIYKIHLCSIYHSREITNNTRCGEETCSTSNLEHGSALNVTSVHEFHSVRHSTNISDMDIVDITIPDLPVVSRCPTVTSWSSRVEMVVGMASPGFKFTLSGEQKNSCLT